MGDEANHNNEIHQKQAHVLVEEATGKRIRKLVIQGPPDPGMNDFAIFVTCDDDTAISIEFSAQVKFCVVYDRINKGNLETIKQYPERVLE